MTARTSRRQLLPIIATIILAAFAARSFAADAERGAWETTYDRPSIEIGGHIADDGGSGEINILAPLIFSEGTDLLFLGADAKVSGFDPNDTGDTVYNVGGYLGYRSVLDNNNGVFGVWAGLDTFNTEDNNEFVRAIAGVEYFGPHVIARANGFIPLDDTSDKWDVRDGAFINTYEEIVPSGFDAELGLRMAMPMESLARPGEFRIFAGAYDFIGLDDDGGDVFGGRARAELDLYPFDASPDTRLSFEASYAYDKHSGDQYAAGLKLSIPLGIANKVTSSHGKDPEVVALSTFGQDLFQPVRRNRDNVSRIRLVERRPASGSGTDTVTLSSVCGGTDGTLTLNEGLSSSTIRHGAQIAVIDPNGEATPLKLNLGAMVAPDGQTLKEILDAEPEKVNTTLKFASSTVDFSGGTVQPVAATALEGQAPAGQTISDATVTVNGNTCSLDLAVQAAPPKQPLTLARVCGGTDVPIRLNAGLKTAVIRRGDDIGIIDPTGSATALTLDIGTMIATDGETLAELLAKKPTTLKSLFKFPLNQVDFVRQSVRPADPVSLDGSAADDQRIKDVTLSVNSLSCSLEVEVESTAPSDDGLTLASVCGGANEDIALNNGLASAAIRRGATLGIIDPAGAATSLKLSIADMVSPGGQTLQQLLASKPKTLVETFSFAASDVDFSSQLVQPAAAVALAAGDVSKQKIKGVTLSVNSKQCSLNVDVEQSAPVDDGLTLASVCGGPGADIALNSGLASSSIRQGAALAVIEPAGAATGLNLDIGGMVSPGGQTLAQLLASKPQALTETFTFPASTVSFTSQEVQPAAAVALATSAASTQKVKSITLSVNSKSCSLNVQNEKKPVQPTGLSLDTVCGGIDVAMPMQTVHQVPLGASQIKQGDLLGLFDSGGGQTTQLHFTLADMVGPDGRTLREYLASSPATLDTVLTFPPSIVDFTASVVEPSLALANSNVQPSWQRLKRFEVTVTDGTVCSVLMKNGLKPGFPPS